MLYPYSILSATIGQQGNDKLKFYALIFMAVISFVLVCSAVIRVIAVFAGKDRYHQSKPADAMGNVLTVALCVAAVIVLAITAYCLHIYRMPQFDNEPAPTQAPTVQTQAPTQVPATQETLATEETTVPTEPDPLTLFKPHSTEKTDPANWDISWEIMVDEEIVESYQRAKPISFGEPEDYFPFEGVATFRGNNYRNDPTYGNAKMESECLGYVWSTTNGSLDGWPGCGWTGQPLIIKWDEETKQIMNMYDSAKEKKDLVEVIYATLDGYVYFLDLDDGTWTRDRTYVGMNMKGSGSLDPRGYPLLYVGSGTVLNGTKPRIHIISLITGEIIYETAGDDPFAPRYWSGFDSAPLVSAETDTLIWPGENGVLYTLELNTKYDPEAGTISVDPKHTARIRYSTNRSGEYYWVGMEDSICMVGNYLFVADNGGMFFCIDINTMELIWAQDIKDDTNASPVFEWGEDGNGYLYIAPSLHWTTNSNWGEISLYKLDAQTGEILWEKPYECGTVEELSGGVQATPALGRVGSNMEGVVIFTVSYTPEMHSGITVALDTVSGEVLWEVETWDYAWSSPVIVYNEENEGFVILPTFDGEVFLLDGETGETIDGVDLDSHVEASPVVYNDMVVIGTRGCEIFGLELY